MKMMSVQQLITLGSLLMALCLTGCGNESGTKPAEEAHGTDGTDSHVHTGDEGTPGPNNGRLITSVSPNFEFLVLEDRKVKITFVDDHVNPVPAGNQIVSLVGGDRLAPTNLAFSKEGDALISDGPLPSGDIVAVVLSVKPLPDADATIEKFNVDFSTCSECGLTEYACICGH